MQEKGSRVFFYFLEVGVAKAITAKVVLVLVSLLSHAIMKLTQEYGYQQGRADNYISTRNKYLKQFISPLNRCCTRGNSNS